MVARPEAGIVEHAAEAVGRLVELGEALRPARADHDDGRLVGRGGDVLSGVHAPRTYPTGADRSYVWRQ